MRKFGSMLVLTALMLFAAASAKAQAQKAAAPPKPSAGMSAEFLAQWNRTGQKLIDMVNDFPEDKLDFKAKPEQRTFAEQMLHIAGANYYFISAAEGTRPPENAENPSRETYKTRAQIVEFIKKSYADGAAVIAKQGDKGMAEIGKSPFSNEMYTHAALWTFAMNHANDHYGQCVVYYRLNGLVPPESRRQE